MGEDLSPAQKQDLTDLVLQHQEVFSEHYYPGEQQSLNTTSVQRQASRYAYPRTGFQRPVGSPYGRRSRKCSSSG